MLAIVEVEPGRHYAIMPDCGEAGKLDRGGFAVLRFVRDGALDGLGNELQ